MFSPKKKIQNYKSFFIITFIIWFLTFFQNCSSGFRVLIDEGFLRVVPSDSQDSGGGNGEGYGGMQDGKYDRMVSNVRCDEGSIASSIIIQSGTGTILTRNIDTCTKTSLGIALSDIVRSRLQQNIIAYLDGIYERNSKVQALREEPPALIAWCALAAPSERFRDFEISIHLHNQDITGEIYFVYANDTLSNLVPAFSLQKQSNQTTLTFSQELFSLVVDSRNPINLTQGKFRSQFKAKLAKDEFVSGDIECRLGGDYDGMIWPAKTLLAGNVIGATMNLGRSNVFASVKGLAFDYLAKIDLASLTSKVFYYQQSARIGSAPYLANQETSLSFQGDFVTPGSMDLFNLDLSTEALSLLSANHTGAIGSIPTSHWADNTVLHSGDYAIYLDFDFEKCLLCKTMGFSDPNLNTEMRFENLYSYNLVTKVRKKLAPTLLEYTSIDRFDILADGRIAFHFVGPGFSGGTTESILAKKGLPLHDYCTVQPDGTEFQCFDLESKVKSYGCTTFYGFVKDFELTKEGLLFSLSGGIDTDQTVLKTKLLFYIRWDGSEFTKIGEWNTIEKANSNGLRYFSALTIADDRKAFIWSNQTVLNFYNLEKKSKSAIPLSFTAGETFRIPKLFTIVFKGQVAYIASINGFFMLLDSDGVLLKQWQILDSNTFKSEFALSALVSLDSNSIYYLEPQTENSANLVWLKLDTQEKITVPNSMINVTSFTKPQYTPDGLAIIFMADANGDSRNELYRIGLDGSGVSNISDRFYQYGGVVNFTILSDTKIYFENIQLDGTKALFIWAPN